MDNFDKAEQAGRELFKEILTQCHITNYKESLEQYDTLDIYYTSLAGDNVGIEIKKRAEQYEVYDTHLLEWSKFIAICRRLQSKEIDKAGYINFFGDSVAYLYPFKNIIRAYKEGQIQVRQLYCNRTTAIDSGKKDKAVLMLPKSIGIRLEKQGDIWIKALN